MLSHQETVLQNKRLKIYLFISSITLFVAVISLVALAFMSREKVRYVEFSTNNDFKFKVLESTEINKSQKDLIIRNQLKQYLQSRIQMFGGAKYNGNNIDNQKVNYVKAFSSPKVFDEYGSEFKRLHKEATFFQRNINVISAVKQKGNKYLFNFQTIDSYEFQDKPNIKRFSVYIEYQFMDPNKLPPASKKLNPLGIQIIWYRGDQETKNINPNSTQDDNA